MQIQRLFSTPFWQDKLDIDCSPIASKCLELRDQKYPNRRLSNVGGWQSDDIHLPNFSQQYSEFVPLVNAVVDSMARVSRSIHPDVKFKLTNAWININEKNNSNKMHGHAGASLSAVVYLQVDENSGQIVFFDDWTPIRHYPLRMPHKRNLLRVEEKIKPFTGMFLAFPGWVTHYVEPSKSDQPRISIAMNFVGG